MLSIAALSGEPFPLSLSFVEADFLCPCSSSPAAFSRNNDLKRHAATHESPLYSCDVGSW